MYVEKVYTGVFNLITLGLDTFGDGVQVGDLIKLPSFYDEAKKIYESWTLAQKEIKAATPEEISSYVNDFTNKLLLLVKVQDAPTQNYKTDNTILALLSAESIVSAIKMKVADGIQWDDVAALPYIISKLWELIGYMPMVKAELNELSKQEISLLASTLVYKVYMIILDWKK